MKEFLDIFIFKPRRTERIIIFSLKVLFATCFSVLIYKRYGKIDIVDQITDLDRLKYFVLDGHLILFAFLFLFLYFLFFKATSLPFRLLGELFIFIVRWSLVIVGNILVLILQIIFFPFFRKWEYKPMRFKFNNDNKELISIPLTKWIKDLFVKAGILKSKKQKIHSSKNIKEALQFLKKELIENKYKMFNKIHDRFILGFLLCLFYTVELHSQYINQPYLKEIVWSFCLLNAMAQLCSFWLYKNVKIIYWFYLMSVRNIHQEEVHRSLMVIFKGENDPPSVVF